MALWFQCGSEPHPWGSFSINSHQSQWQVSCHLWDFPPPNIQFTSYCERPTCSIGFLLRLLPLPCLSSWLNPTVSKPTQPKANIFGKWVLVALAPRWSLNQSFKWCYPISPAKNSSRCSAWFYGTGCFPAPRCKQATNPSHQQLDGLHPSASLQECGDWYGEGGSP